MIKLYGYQEQALGKMHNGCILNGGVGSGKSRTSLAYYFLRMGGSIEPYEHMHNQKPLYIITTAKKRDSGEWIDEILPFKIDNYTVDSWNNIKKYAEVKDAFFIFDEDRVCGKGAWVKAFLKITRNNNEWIILSATPGDSWEDYAPVFIANGFYRNRTEFNQKHILWSPYCSKYPKICGYIHTGMLQGYRRKILVNMDYERKTKANHIDIWCDYDPVMYKQICKDRWNVFKEEPITDAGGLCYCLRQCVNSNPDRVAFVLKKASEVGKVIVFYNYNYELDILKEALHGYNIAEWNGHRHEPIPDTDSWVYLVQYSAGAEGWNCILTDTIIFFSQSYSYKQTIQAAGRIDRLNTPYTELYYYHLISHSGIDIAIRRALNKKKNFNEKDFVGEGEFL